MYNITPETLRSCRLAAQINSAEHVVGGSWHIEFMIESLMKSQTLTLRNPNGEISSMSIKASPVSTEIHITAVKNTIDAYSRIYSELTNEEKFLVLRDGSQISLKRYSASMDLETGKGIIKLISQYNNQDEISAIVIDGRTYSFE